MARKELICKLFCFMCARFDIHNLMDQSGSKFGTRGNVLFHRTYAGQYAYSSTAIDRARVGMYKGTSHLHR